MTKTLEITNVQPGKDKRDRAYIRLNGYDQNGRFTTAVAFGPVATSLDDHIRKLVPDGQDPGKHGFVIEVHGREMVKVENNREKKWFAVDRYDILMGPSVELHRARKNGAAAIENAGELLQSGDVSKAYRVLEEFVSRLARVPAPSVEFDVLFDNVSLDDTDGVEEEALRKLEGEDTRKGISRDAEAKPVLSEAAADETPEINAAEVSASSEPDESFGEDDAAEENLAEFEVEESKAAAAPSKPAFSGLRRLGMGGMRR